MGTAASEPRCRCVYLHHGLDPHYWVRRMEGRGNDRPLWKRAPPRVVFSLLCSPPGTIAMAVVPRGKKEVVIVPSWRG